MSTHRRISLGFIVVFFLMWPAHGQQTLIQSSHGTRYSMPPKGTIPVAFVITDDAVTIDFAGPWEVFKDVFLKDRGKTLAEQAAFRLYTVSDSREPVKTSGGMRIVPDYTFDDAPRPAIVVVPAQSGRSPKMLEWIRKMTTQSDVVMSVCTGAYVLGDAGVLKGKKATTHHLYYDEFQQTFPDVLLQKGKRFVQSDSVIFTAGGLSSGIDLALHVVELYFGPSSAEETAKILEYKGTDWKGDGSTSASANATR
jgi:transcriptional regulator GlxA family with amidase domain